MVCAVVNEGVSFSFDTCTVSDSDAKDSRPDISVIHIVGGTMQKPTIEDVRERYRKKGVDEKSQLNHLLSQYIARAGIKIVHRCVVLIGEFKRAPARAEFKRAPGQAEADVVTNILNAEEVPDDVDALTAGDWEAKLQVLLKEAIEDTMRYCAIHFIIYPSASEVIALASAGPFWQWATIRREQVPLFEWLSGLTVESEENEELRNNFNASFGHDYYVLTTAESDDQINKMRNVMFKLINNSHQEYPTFPTDFGFTLIPDKPKAQYFSVQ
ncbi:hypothetical protein K443DRAFT_117642 [Laccaria amethystina LaAM-08-1]|uniref:Uncharacterized protein n=1 Tax=Laccaria amethystina LaAM-08-1 TaxID=1095629 RepID=A0A0C9WPX1_9AGAR|nr:hypothetical protein K443DRAFT_117642 [Laccaria amethystina LaAM-08-1]